jgi:hypothetical protein
MLFSRWKLHNVNVLSRDLPCCIIILEAGGGIVVATQVQHSALLFVSARFDCHFKTFPIICKVQRTRDLGLGKLVPVNYHLQVVHNVLKSHEGDASFFFESLSWCTDCYI